MSIAAVIGMTDDMPLTLGVTVVCAILLLRTGQNTKIKGDAAIAMLSVGSLAFGYLLMNLFSTSSNLSGDVCSTLFGSTSILTLTRGEVRLCAALSAMRVYQSFRSVTICSAVLSVFCAVCGILLSILAGTPVGSTIVAVDIAAFGLFTLAGRLKGGASA